MMLYAYSFISPNSKEREIMVEFTRYSLAVGLSGEEKEYGSQHP